MPEDADFAPKMFDAQDAADRRERGEQAVRLNRRVAQALLFIEYELMRAIDKHTQPFHSHHEAYAVVLEELDEYKAEVFKGGSTPRDPEALRTELIQTAAMATRALVDLCL
jgi:hypothetical protein